MKNNDLSNYTGTSIAFRCEDFFIKSRNNKIKDRILNKIFGELSTYEIDREISAVMYHIYRKSDMTVDLVVMESNYKGKLKKLLENQPYNRIILIRKITEITQRLLIGDISYYVDGDTIRRDLINNKNAVTLDFIKTLL